ncbi:hypothetical protein MHK_001717, partial [Candidatus Magnetomorum sp. HK-1]
LSIAITTSDASLISVGNITYTCSANTIYLSLTPSSNQSGYLSITVSVTDTGEQTSETSFGITVNSINDLPQIGSISNQTIDEDTVSDAINFTVTDVETAGCSHGVTFASSDITLIPVESISYTCSSGIFYLSFTPSLNQSGITTITVTVSDDGLLTATSSFTLTITDTPDAPVISSIENQSTLVNTTTSAINLTVTDVDADDLTLTAFSSDTDIVAIENISFSGTTANRTLTITPSTSVIGSLSITVIVSDSSG